MAGIHGISSMSARRLCSLWTNSTMMSRIPSALPHSKNQNVVARDMLNVTVLDQTDVKATNVNVSRPR